MTSSTRLIASWMRRLGQVWLCAIVILVCAILPACTCSDGNARAPASAILACTSHVSMPAAPAITVKRIVPGAIPVSFSATDSGDATLSIPIAISPGRGAPDVRISYSSANGDGAMGVGFSLSAGSSITRCPKTMATDGTIHDVTYDKNDAYCLDGQRMVEVSRNGQNVEFRTYPDTQIKILGHVLENGPASFEVWLPSGDRIDYGATPETRPMAANGVARAWLAGEKRDTRGNGTLYDWCFAENDDGTTAEYALTSIRYSVSEDAEPERTVVFDYAVRDDMQTTYTHGMALQHSLQLREVQSFGPREQLAYRYEFVMERSETTGRTLLQSVQQCGADGACQAPTRFHYGKAERGFDEVVTDIATPLSDKASPMLFDFDRDGLSDYIVGDSTPSSTPSHPITEWRIAKNTGGTFAAEKVALLQEWSVVQDANDPSDPTLMQPEVGTSLDYDQDGFTDILLHDVYGNANNHLVLKAKSDNSFALSDSNIPRPFPLQQSPKGLRSAAGAVHLADCDGDAMPDLIQCTDNGDLPLSTWRLHLWQPGGFDPDGTTIDTLTGIPCGVEVHTVDANRDSITDLIMPGYARQGGATIELSGTYSVFRRRSDGTWQVFDTLLPTPVNGGRTAFLDVNGDGLPDAVQSGSADGRLVTYMNTGLGFAKKPTESLPSDGPLPQSKYFHLAQPLDFDGDSKTDLLVPMIDAKSPTLPRWVILRATGGSNGFTFEQVESGIPFDAVLSDVVELADPRGPRIGDLNGDGAPDIAIFLDNRLHLFKNRAVDPDVLVGFSDGSNDHDPDETGFVPNVSITYAHLIDDSKTTGQPPKDEDFYISHADAVNDCAYPRTCIVGAKRVVRGYQVNDGQGGMRRFEVRYRDGRSDRLHGWLGFGERLLTDVETGATTETFYDNITKLKVGERDVYPFAGQIVKQWFWAPGLATQPNPDQIEMAFADRTLEVMPTNGGQTYFTLATKTHSRRMQGSFSGAGTMAAYVGLVEKLENATMLRDATVDVLGFDEYHNVLEVKASTIGVDATKHITRSVRNDVGKWMLGLPDIQTECSTGSGLQQCRTVTRTTNAFGEVETESTSSSDNLDDTKLAVTYKRDEYGNVTHVSATDAFGHTRESTTIYDNEGLFPIKLINALGHETTQEYDATLGVLKKQTDPNGVSAEWSYDSFGRLESETRPDGSQTKTATTLDKIDGVWRLRARTTTTGGADDETIFDSLGRPIRTFSHAPEVKANTSRVMQVIEYDRLSGNVARQSVPTAEGTPDVSLTFDEYDFDALGREVRHVTPWNAVTTTKYEGLLVDSTDPLLKHTITQVDPLGRPVIITDAANGKTKSTYGPFDALFTVTDPGNAITKWTRDAFGRVRQLDEPDRGTTHFVNDGFGDVLTSMDASGRVITFGVDTLGRVETRKDTLGAQVSTTTWTWDTAPNGIGRLQSVASPDGVKTYSYSTRGQIETVTLGVNGDSFTARIAYDDVGRVKALDYPQVLGASPFGVAYDYDPHGFQLSVRDKQTNDAFWELKDVDDVGRYAVESFGNGTKTVRGYDNDKQTLKSITTTKGASTIQQLSYDWDAQLNLKSRTDALQPQNKTERFRHDGLDRLTCAYFSPIENANAACDTSFGYAPNGNLTTKSDVGALFYTDPKHPHAVTNAGGGVYGYDAVGNQITRPGGVSITYTAFDLPKTITQNAKTVSFGYDGDQQRIRKTTSNSETLYFEDLFEHITTAGTKEFRYYVQSPERTIAIVTRGGNELGTKYLHVDHLGSTETITNEQGSQVEKRSYDPFGQRRNVIWGLPPPASFASKSKQGFTGHDEEDEFGLVNMKGRLYDPHIARFLNTDPIIANVFDGQSFSAYSYVRNNPLAFVDPSGFAGEGVVHQPGFPDVPLANDVVTPSLSFLIGQDVRAQLTHPIEPTGTGAPTNDTSTTGTGSTVELPVMESEHPSGVGTDDPFGVYPTDLTLGYAEPITVFDELVAGDPAGGRRTFIIEDDPGIGRDIRLAFGVQRQTVMLRPHIGGSGIDDREAAQDRLVGAAALTLVTMLTPGPADDIAVAGAIGGRWVQASETMSARAAAYQARFGRMGQVYLLNGVKFDGVANGVLLEAKGPGYATFVRDGVFRDWFRGDKALVKQAEHQIIASRGAPIQWHFAEESAANATRALLKSPKFSGIQIIHTPPP